MKDFRRALEFYVLKRLGIKRFKNSHRGSPLSPHYSTVLNVNLNVNSSSNPTRNPSPVLSPYLETPTAMPFRLFNPNRHSTASSILQMSPVTEKTSDQPSRHKLYLLTLGDNRKRPVNSTFSWPPTLLSRSLVSHQSLLDSNSSIVDKKRHFQSLEGVGGFWSPFWEPNENSSPDNSSANSESRFVYEISLDKNKTDYKYPNKLHLSNSAPPSPAIKILALKSRPSSFITSSTHYQRLYSQCQKSLNKSEEKLKTDTSTMCFSVFRSKSDEQLCNYKKQLVNMADR
ncbi:hypothetical protein Anas_07737 [Armadillidium nasatum]|uniref:Uncharacterized protein n=1 Tax=Armadillidium nasatum TaxID=96803 RepID=A0A5N5SQS0_9CRUS|nr:hypothetical protein Anas_07737 [Armadillidium nasatum]